MNHKEYMEKAIRLSQQKMDQGHGGPFGAVIVKNGRVVAEGWNEVTSSFDPTAHAEVMAIRKASKKLKNFDLGECVIYTSCEPCPMCLAAIYWAGIKKIYFGNTRKDAAQIGFDDDFLYHEVARPPERRKVKSHQLLRNQAHKVFEAWREKEDKIPY